MIAPTTAPAAAPDRDTVRARYPSQPVSALTPSAHGSAAIIAPRAASTDAAVIRLPIHSTTPAVAGTEMLSSSRIGIVSTSAASSAAASGAAIANASGGTGVTDGRTHRASATPAAPPQTMNASVPAIDLSGFQGRRPEATAEVAEIAKRRLFSACSACSAVASVRDRPSNVAKPSPNARMPHAAAAMSRRVGKASVSSRTDSG